MVVEMTCLISSPHSLLLPLPPHRLVDPQQPVEEPPTGVVPRNHAQGLPAGAVMSLLMHSPRCPLEPRTQGREGTDCSIVTQSVSQHGCQTNEVTHLPIYCKLCCTVYVMHILPIHHSLLHSKDFTHLLHLL